MQINGYPLRNIIECIIHSNILRNIIDYNIQMLQSLLFFFFVLGWQKRGWPKSILFFGPVSLLTTHQVQLQQRVLRSHQFVTPLTKGIPSWLLLFEQKEDSMYFMVSIKSVHFMLLWYYFSYLFVYSFIFVVISLGFPCLGLCEQWFQHISANESVR